MISKQQIEKLLSGMTYSTGANYYLLKKYFGSFEYRDSENQTILHILVDNKYDHHRCLKAIETCLEKGVNPNAKADFNYNFIQTALYTGYSEQFILSIITEALKHGLDINHVDDDKDTIMHTAIYSDDYLGNVINIYKLLIENGFDSTKVDHDGRNIVEAMIYMSAQKQYTQAQIAELRDLYQTQVKNNPNQPSKSQDTLSTTNDQSSPKPQIPVKPTITLSPETIKELEQYGQILNQKQYSSVPTIGRDAELKNLVITLAADKKNPIIVGESGVGKTAIVDELAYRIQTGQVPKFLANQVILEVCSADLVAGCCHVGDFEKKITELLSLCQKNKILLFIDEIHTIYGTGASDKKNMDFAAILKHYIDRSSLKVIGTTTNEEYTKYFGTDALKRRFEKIVITEPTEDILFQIINKVLNDYSYKNNLDFQNETIKENIIQIIVDATAKSHRIYNDVVNNPDLSISIIDKAFAFAKYYDGDAIGHEHFIDSIESCHRLSEPARQQAIANLKNLNPNLSKSAPKILKLQIPKK